MSYQYPLNGGRINASIGGNTVGTGSLVSTGTLTFAGGNNITLSQNGNAITISGANAAGGSINFSAGATSSNLAAVTFANSNGVSFGLNGGTLTGTVATTYAASNHSHGNPTLNLTNLNGTVASASNGMTMSLSAASQSAQTIGFSAGNNTSLTSSGTFDARSMNFNGLGAASAGFSNSSLFISTPIQSEQTQNVHNLSFGGNTSGIMAQVSSGTLSLMGGDNITLSQNGNSVSIIGVSGGGGGGLALAGGGTTYTSGTANLSAAGGALTIASGAGQAFNFSVPGTSSLVATGGFSISTSGNTVFIGAPTPIATPSLSRWEYPNHVFSPLGAPIQSNLSLQHVYIPLPLIGASARVGAGLTIAGITASTASVNLSLSMGIYRLLNGSTLTLVSSGTANNGFSWSNSTQSSAYGGLRELTVPMVVNVTPGEYWVGAILNTASTYSGVMLSMYGNNQIGAPGMLGIMGNTNSNAGRDVLMGQGLYSTGALPPSIVISAVSNFNTQAQRAAFYHALYNATY